MNSLSHNNPMNISQPNILIVDDVPANLLAIRRLLHGLNINIIEANGGNEALHLMLKHDFALVLLDVQMPDIDGYEVAELMRGDGSLECTPIIFVTATSREKVHELKGYDAGAVDYITKPLDKTVLRSKVTIFAELYETRKKLDQAKKDADAASLSKSSFLANMSHEIRTPLNGVIGMTRFLTESTNLPEEEKHYAKTALTSANELLEIINDILDLSKIESGKLDIELVAFDFLELAEKLTELLAMRAEKNGVQMILDYAPDAPRYVISDPVRVRQILYNLAGNAIKFTEEGYIKISIRAEDKPDGKILFSVEVEDTGIGIPEDKHEYIFTKFTQADASTTRKFGGTGLGLAISKQFTEMMGGNIELESSLGKGTTFRFTLPMDHADEHCVKANTENNISPIDGTTTFDYVYAILAEDNDVNQMVATKILKDAGCNVALARNGKEAVALAESENFNIIFMDCQMPEMDGFEATKIIKGKNPDIPIIAFTANALKGDRERCIAAGMDDYIPKPVMPEAVKEILCKWLSDEKKHIA